MIHGLNNGQILAGLSVGLLGWRTRGCGGGVATATLAKPKWLWLRHRHGHRVTP